MPAPNCTNPVTWNGTEDGQVQDNSAVAALTAAVNELKALQKKAEGFMSTFEAQGCPAGKDGCSFQSNVRADAIVTVTGPTKKASPNPPFKVAWICDLKYAWSDTIYCYKKKEDKEAADAKRAAEKKAAEEKMTEEAKKQAKK